MTKLIMSATRMNAGLQGIFLRILRLILIVGNVQEL